MRDLGTAGSGSGAVARPLPPTGEITRFTQQLAGSGASLTDAERIDAIRALEELKCAAEGAQAALTADFDRSQRRRAAERGVPAERQARGIALQVALARRTSHCRGQRLVGLARIAQAELPCAYAAFRAGKVDEWRMTVLARETACLSREQRMLVDEAVAGDTEKFAALSIPGLVGAVLDVACRLDPAAAAERRRRVEGDRHTTLRPAPDTMTWFGALLPVKDGVSVHAALLAEADRRRAAGDPRSRGAIMADTLVDRVLAPHVATTGGRPELPLVIDVVVDDSVLLGDRDGSGHVVGFGPVPGDLLRQWLADHADRKVQDFVRRLYRRPATRDLVAMDTKARRFEGGLAAYLRLRDQRCRTPGCGAPIRHLDHAVAYAEGGATSASNGQGLCEACNHAKQADGWSARPVPGGVHTITIITPTGHRYLSTVPTNGPPLWMEIYPHAARVA